MFIFSPRNVNQSHGTGVQLGYLAELSGGVLINFGHGDPGEPDEALHFESRLARSWPLRHRGRQWWNRVCEDSRLSYWQPGGGLSRRGRAAASRWAARFEETEALVVIAGEADARRFNAMREYFAIPYRVIFYDYVGPMDKLPREGSALAVCFQEAEDVLCISSTLQELALRIGARSVSAIRFFKKKTPEERSTVNGPLSERQERDPWRILMLSHSDPKVLADVVDVVDGMNGRGGKRQIEIHFVGGQAIEHLNKGANSCLIRHGRVAAEERDAITRACDFAVLAGPANDPRTCPFSRFSVPSKLGDFAAAGLPVIAWVSEGSAAHQAITAEMNDFVTPVHGRGECASEIGRVLGDPVLYRSRREAALGFAEQYVLLPEAAAGVVGV